MLPPALRLLGPIEHQGAKNSSVKTFLPAYREPRSGSGAGPQLYRVVPGYVVFVSALISGWPAWWANPAFWVAVAFLTARRSRTALALAVAGLLLVLSPMPVATVFQVGELFRLMAGYWIWSSAIAALALVCLKERSDARRCKPANKGLPSGDMASSPQRRRGPRVPEHGG